MTATAALCLTSSVYSAVFAAKAIEIRWADSDRNPKALVNAIIAEFQKSNPGIKVKYESWVGWDYQRLITRITAAAAPDVIWCWGEGLKTMMAKGLTLDLTKYASAYKLGKTFADMQPEVLKSCKLNGSLRAIPKFTGTVALYYNKAMFDRAGIAPPTRDWNWDSLLSNGLKLVKKNETGKITQFGLREVSGNIPASFIWQNGALIIPDGEIVGSKLLIDQPKAIEAIKFAHSLIWKHHINPTQAEETPSGWEFFAKGKAAMWYGGSWDLDIITRGLKDEWNVAELPAGPKGERGTMHTLDAYIIPKNSKNKNAAFKFLAFLSSPQGERLRMKAQPPQPANISLIREWIEQMPQQLKKPNLDLSAFANGMEYAKGEYYLDHWTVVKPEIDEAMKRIFHKNTMDVDLAIATLVKNVNRRLAAK